MNSDMRHFIELLWGMTEKELRARYKHTVFGFLWIVVNPLLQMFVIGFVFSFFMKEPVEHYYFHLFASLLIWNFFSLSLSKATPSIVYERALIKKSAFPRHIIPLSIILSNFIHMTLAYCLYLIPLLLINTLTFTGIVLFLLGLGALILFTIGLSLLTSALNVRFRDVSFFVQAILILWFYATPIVYSLSQMPRSLLWIWRFNPLTSVMQLIQAGLLQAPLPGPAMIVSNMAVITLITVLGIVVFNRLSATFDDWV